MTIGGNIKKNRNSKGLTQKELAEKANISRSYLADVERNRYNPSIDTLKSLASALDINLIDLLNGSNNNQKQEIEELDEDIRRIERARKNMPERDKKRMMDILKLSFEDYFNDED